MGFIHCIEAVNLNVLKTDPVHIEFKEDAEPSSVHVSRRVAIPLLPAVEAELKKMEKEEIIKEVKKPTKFVLPW